jgi:endonuclease I
MAAMQKTLLLLLALLAFRPSMAQVPANYYNNAQGLNGENLRAALSLIIRPHTTLSYTPDLWNAYHTTDKKNNGKLWDIYSDIPGGTAAYEYTLGTDQCGNGANHENTCYNREHLWPQSKFNGSSPMYTDLYLVYPTDYYVNGQRSNLPFGKVGTATKTFTNGTKIGNNTYAHAPSGSCFEPIDSFKGDIARSYFYITTCYRNDSNLFNNWEMATQVTLNPWAIAMLLEWHHLDPVSQKETDRNNAVYALQGNRNPFIDSPAYADCIWGAGNCIPDHIAETNKQQVPGVFPNPAHSAVTISWQALSPQEVLRINIWNGQGQLMYAHEAPAGAAHSRTIPIVQWPQGIYFLQTQTPAQITTQKLLVE